MRPVSTFENGAGSLIFSEPEIALQRSGNVCPVRGATAPDAEVNIARHAPPG